MELDAEPTYAEVSRAVRKVAKGKAAGEDLITVELLQSKTCIEWLHRVVVATWRGEEAPRDWQDGIVVPLYKGKGSRQECDNSRGITLLSIPGKVYARVIQHRLVRFAERRLSENQNGFRAGRSCTDTLFTVKRLMEMSSSRGSIWELGRGGVPNQVGTEAGLCACTDFVQSVLGVDHGKSE